jgi:CRP-like cAMP-binding protein
MECKACSTEFEALLLSSAETRAWWASLPRKVLAKGEALLRAGDTPSQAWRIQQGLLRIYYLSADGTERNRSFHAEGHWVGAGVPLLTDPRPSPYCIEALEPAVVVCAPLGALQQRCAAEPRAGAAMQELAAWNFERQSRREAELLLMNATQRYRSVMDELGMMAERIPLVHIASYIGITNVALSRLRRRASGLPREA